MKMRRRDFLGKSLAAGAAGVMGASGKLAPGSVSGSKDETGHSEEGLSSGMAQRGNPEAAITPADLRCEFLRTPLGIDASRPRLSWRLESRPESRLESRFESNNPDARGVALHVLPSPWPGPFPREPLPQSLPGSLAGFGNSA